MTEAIEMSRIITTERFHSSEGDVSELVESIRAVGLLHPVVVTKDGVLIAGKRRLEAWCSLGWAEIPVTVADPQDVRRAEADENIVRLPFTPTEALAVKRYFKPTEREAAKERRGERTDRHPAKFAGSPGNARDKVAELTGFSHETLRKAEVAELANLCCLLIPGSTQE